MSTDILTDRGIEKLALAAGSSTQVAITHMGLGDGNGALYVPSSSQTALRRERARQPIERRMMVAPNTWRVTAEFDTDTEVFDVREIGFFDADNDMIAFAVFDQARVDRTGSSIFVIEHGLELSAARDGLIFIDAPDDALVTLAVVTGTAIANLQHQQLVQAGQLARAELY